MIPGTLDAIDRARRAGITVLDQSALPPGGVDGRDRPRSAAAPADLPDRGHLLRLCPLCEHTYRGYGAVCERCDG